MVGAFPLKIDSSKINLRFILQGSKYSFGTKDFRKEMEI